MPHYKINIFLTTIKAIKRVCTELIEHLIDTKKQSVIVISHYLKMYMLLSISGKSLSHFTINLIYILL